MVRLTSHYIRRRWLDFRNGHGIYLIFLMTFVNFILIGYNFAIKKSPILSEFFGDTLFFAVVFILIYIPLAIIIGYYHRRHQYVVEAEVLFQENWILAWMMRHQMRLIKGVTTPKEEAQMQEFLEKVLKRHKKEGLMGLENDYDEDK